MILHLLLRRFHYYYHYYQCYHYIGAVDVHCTVLEPSMTVRVTSVIAKISSLWRSIQRHSANRTSTIHTASHTAPSDRFVNISTDLTRKWF